MTPAQHRVFVGWWTRLRAWAGRLTVRDWTLGSVSFALGLGLALVPALVLTYKAGQSDGAEVDAQVAGAESGAARSGVEVTGETGPQTIELPDGSTSPGTSVPIPSESRAAQSLESGSSADEGDKDESDNSDDDEVDDSPRREGQLTPPPAAPVAHTPQKSSRCPADGTVVTSAEELQDALDGSGPDTVIHLSSGVYQGEFVIDNPASASEPSFLCGEPGAVLEGEGPDDGYILHLDGADYWTVIGLEIREGQKGIMVDSATGVVLDSNSVHDIGDEAIHLRGHSSDNIVRGNEIHTTGLRREKFGEGVYIGSAQSNWCDISDCQADKSDRNLIEGNTIWDVTAEAIDIKEGTTGGIVRGNAFDGSQLTEDGGDSWVDVKGNDWLIENNQGAQSNNDGYQTHEILDGWGTRNIFRGNSADVNGPGFGYSLTPENSNVVECSNTASRADEGYANVQCRE